MFSYRWHKDGKFDTYFQAKATDEGLILDVVVDGEVVATAGMTAEEWTEALMSEEI